MNTSPETEMPPQEKAANQETDSGNYWLLFLGLYIDLLDHLQIREQNSWVFFRLRWRMLEEITEESERLHICYDQLQTQEMKHAHCTLVI